MMERDTRRRVDGMNKRFAEKDQQIADLKKQNQGYATELSELRAAVSNLYLRLDELDSTKNM